MKRGGLPLASASDPGRPAKRPDVARANRDRALAALKATWGYDAFRGRQEEAVLAMLAGRDALVVMPTGGGKTLCYAVPALLLPGLVVVVSPLLALMQDQESNLRAVGLAAAALSSATPAAKRAQLMADLGAPGGGPPATRLLLVTPELLAASGKFRSVLRRLYDSRSLSLFAIDEAHCISTWGHDFRPAYRELQALRRDFPGVPLLALTATAAGKVQDDICSLLRMREPLRLLSSFNRPNISYAVRYLDAEEVTEQEALVRLLEERKRQNGGVLPCSIVYCQKRDTCMAVAASLRGRHLAAAGYHGALPEGARREVLRQWQADEVPVVVATIAFGMGIDKAGVRLVVHFNLPRCLEGFYQEAGRAGRDGAPAESILFYSRAARQRFDWILEQDGKEKEEEARQRQQQRQGATGSSSSSNGGEWEAPAATATAEEAARVKETAWQAFGCVVDWALGCKCRRARLLDHFGETLALPPDGRCAGTGDGEAGGCDVCRDHEAVKAQLEKLQAQELQALAAGARGAWRGGGGGGKGDADDEYDMFAVRGGGGTAAGGEGAGGGADGEAGPGLALPGRSSPPPPAADVAAARYASAAALAAAGGAVNGTYFAVLEARERAHERRMRESGGDLVDRMLASHSGGGGGGGGTATAPPDAGVRSNAVTKLAAALGGNPNCAGVDVALLRQLAAAVDADVYGAGTTGRQVYTSRMGGLLSRAKHAPSAVALLPGPGPGPGPAPADALVRQLLPALLQAEVAAAEVYLSSANAGGTATVASTGGSGCGGGSSGSEARIAARLLALAGVAVTVEAVKEGNVGRRLGALGRKGSGQVVEAARKVVAAWKERLPQTGAKAKQEG